MLNNDSLLGNKIIQKTGLYIICINETFNEPYNIELFINNKSDNTLFFSSEYNIINIYQSIILYSDDIISYKIFNLNETTEPIEIDLNIIYISSI